MVRHELGGRVRPQPDRLPPQGRPEHDELSRPGGDLLLLSGRRSRSTATVELRPAATSSCPERAPRGRSEGCRSSASAASRRVYEPGRQDERGQAATARAAASATARRLASCPMSSSSGSASRSCAWPSESSASTTRAPIRPSTLRVSACAQTPPNAPGAGADHRDGLAAERVRRRGPRAPVERVLERSRDRAVVLRRRDQDGVRRRDGRAEACDGERRRALLVLVERRARRGGPPRRRARRRPGGSPPRAAGAAGCTSLRAGCLRCRGSASLRRLDQLELGAELDVVADGEAAGRERSVPVEAERRAVDDRLELEPDALSCRRTAGHRPAERAVDRDRLA